LLHIVNIEVQTSEGQREKAPVPAVSATCLVRTLSAVHESRRVSHPVDVGVYVSFLFLMLLMHAAIADSHTSSASTKLLAAIHKEHIAV
jgi:hypothetical protein